MRRMDGSRSATRRGVKARAISARMAVWRGGSRELSVGFTWGLCCLPTELNEPGSPAAARTSAKRESATKRSSGSR